MKLQARNGKSYYGGILAKNAKYPGKEFTGYLTTFTFPIDVTWYPGIYHVNPAMVT